MREFQRVRIFLFSLSQQPFFDKRTERSDTIILGISRIFGLGRNIYPSAFSFYFAVFIQAEDNVSNFLFIKAGFSLNLCEINSLLGAFDGFHYDVNCI